MLQKRKSIYMEFMETIVKGKNMKMTIVIFKGMIMMTDDDDDVS